MLSLYTIDFLLSNRNPEADLQPVGNTVDMNSREEASGIVPGHLEMPLRIIGSGYSELHAAGAAAAINMAINCNLTVFSSLMWPKVLAMLATKCHCRSI